ncbi:glycosyltransferase family 2 protein [Lachnoclostridium sp. Marseille-P6806]|uniref:glycosyltransferase family 2 protein n=1 Tax=Lachnoclostridium sp. Marseille-P6806 TaxID=2364793 RepID=UPI0010301817|nr:glycosyltransferase family A protein [Lachnoclostridium sp. Marseille-P6806]
MTAMRTGFLAILTPSYERADRLPKLYESLCRQSDPDFVWVVADDGSTDGTGRLIRGWQEEGRLDIEYLFKENGGKHTALALGIRRIAALGAQLTFIVDSDDWLTEDAVASIRAMQGREWTSERRIGGFCFLRRGSDGTINGGAFPQDIMTGNYTELRINRGDLGDKAEVYDTRVLEEYPFPCFGEERFLPEDAVWIRMAARYDMVFVNQAIYYCDYLEGGLTRSGRRMKLHSPCGMMYRSAGYLENPRVNRRTRLKMLLLWHIYHSFAVKNGMDAETERLCAVRKNFWFYLLLLPGRLLGLVWKWKYA